jgi:hypothetical protein
MDEPSCQWEGSSMLHLIAILATSPVNTYPPAPAPTEERGRAAGNAFWAAFNTCDRKHMEATLAPDVEFYHDKTGATISRDAVATSFMNGPCGTTGFHVRRELVAGSLSYGPGGASVDV